MTVQIFYTEGAGNTFFLSFDPAANFEMLLGKAESMNIDPDGYILCAKKDEEHKYVFNFYNKDGSNVDFCGNALRAVGICYQSYKGALGVNLQTNVGDFQVVVQPDKTVTAQMPTPQDKGFVKINQNLEVPYILSGVPHLVFDFDQIGQNLQDLKALENYCKKIRGLKLDGAESYNLSFYKQRNANEVDCITFERGVEDFTQACGSGALSVAYVVSKKRLEPKINLKMPGGKLAVFKKENNVYMNGPAQINQIIREE